MSPIPLKPNPRYDHVFAIVRFDSDAAEAVRIDARITIKKIVWDAEQADSEVRRLNKLNAGKGCHYFSQVTRLERTSMTASEVGADVTEMSSAQAE